MLRRNLQKKRTGSFEPVPSSSVGPNRQRTPSVQCSRCRHYYVTWDPKFPRGCRAYGFKTKHLPSRVVEQSSGMPCLHYEPKDLPDNGRLS